MCCYCFRVLLLLTISMCCYCFSVLLLFQCVVTINYINVLLLFQYVVTISMCCYYSNVLLLFQCPFSTDFREIEWSAPCLVPCPVPGSGRHASADPTLDLVSFKWVLLVLEIQNYCVLQVLCFATQELSCYCILQDLCFATQELSCYYVLQLRTWKLVWTASKHKCHWCLVLELVRV